MTPDEKRKWCEEHGCTCSGNKDITHGLANNHPCCGCWPEHSTQCQNTKVTIDILDNHRMADESNKLIDFLMTERKLPMIHAYAVLGATFASFPREHFPKKLMEQLDKYFEELKK